MIRLFGARTSPDACRQTARRLLAHAVRAAWGWEELPPITRDGLHKPFFPDFRTFRFSLSHSGPYALCALSDEGEVGADIEVVRAHRPDLPRYVMSEAEFTAFDGTWEDFTRVWTLKEAYAKYLGRSIWPPKRHPVPSPVPCRSYAGADWRAALCGDGALPDEICWIGL